MVRGNELRPKWSRWVTFTFESDSELIEDLLSAECRHILAVESGSPIGSQGAKSVWEHRFAEILRPAICR